MNNNDLQKAYYKILDCLTDERLLSALEVMGELAKEADNPNAQAELDELYTSYKYMLSYYEQGINDPERTRIFNVLMDKAAKLNAKLLRSADSRNSQLFYWQCARQRKARSLGDYQRALESYTENLALMELANANALQTDTKRGKLRADHERTVQEMFTDVWTSDFWQDIDLAEARSLMLSTLVPTSDIVMLVSAVTLGLLKTFDAQKYLFLMDAYFHDDELVSQRALLGFVIVYFHCKREIQLAPELTTRIEQLKNDPYYNEDVTDVYLEMMLTLEIDKIRDTLENKVYPNLYNNMMDMANSPGGINLEELLSKGNTNPGQIDETTNRDLMRNFSKMAGEGVDLNFCNFSHLKKYDFFREMSNWFLPYDPLHSMVTNALKGDQKNLMTFAKAIGHNPTFCDSDKYSFISFTITMPEDLKQAFVQQHALFKVQSVEDNRDARLFALRRSVHDYYRFFKLFPKHNEFPDPFFTRYFDYSDIILNELTNDREPMMEVGDYLLEKECFEEATHFYANKLQHDATDLECLEKMGTCYEQLQLYSKAIEYFSKAELMDPNNDLLIHNLAFCYMSDLKYPKAIDYYKQLLQKAPEEVRYLEEIAECYEENGELQKALEVDYKILYLDENNMIALSGTAWINFQCKQAEKAEMYYDRLMEHYADVVDNCDLIQAGMVAWVQRKYDKAESLFVKASNSFEDGIESVCSYIERLEPELIDNGINKEEFPLMYDTIRLKFKHQKER